MKQVFEPASQVQSWYIMESCGALKQVKPRSAADARLHDILLNTTVHKGKRYDVLVAQQSCPTNVQVAQQILLSAGLIRIFGKTLTRDQLFRQKYSNAIKDLDKGNVVKFRDAHKVENCSERELYLPHDPIINPKKPGNFRRLLNRTDKFHCASLIKPLLTEPVFLQNLNYVLLRLRQHPFAVSADIEGMFLQVGV